MLHVYCLLEHDYWEIAACLLFLWWHEYCAVSCFYQVQPRTAEASGEQDAAAASAEQLVTENIFSLAMITVTLLHVYCFIESMVSSLYPSIFKSNQGMQPGMTGPTGSGRMIMGGSSRTGCWAHTFFYNSQASNQHSRP